MFLFNEIILHHKSKIFGIYICWQQNYIVVYNNARPTDVWCEIMPC